MDAQIHSAAPGRGAWDASPGARREGHLFPERVDVLAEMEAAGVDVAILVPPLSWREAPDNEPWLADAASFPNRFGVFGRFRPELGEQELALRELMSRPGMLGMRLSVHDRRGNSATLTDGSTDWFWAACERDDIPVMINAPERWDVLADIARRHPGLRLCIDHLGLRPDRVYDDLGPAIGRLTPLAELANVVVKATALPAVVDEAFPFPGLGAAVSQVIEAFGSSRVFWGSDLSRLPCRYSELVTFFAELVDYSSTAERNEVLGEAILRWLGWDPQPQADQPLSVSDRRESSTEGRGL